MPHASRCVAYKTFLFRLHSIKNVKWKTVVFAFVISKLFNKQM